MAEQDQTHETSDQGLLENSAEDLYEHAPCGYLSTHPDGAIAKVNETFLTWTGYRRDDLVGRKRFQDLLPAGGRIYHETHYAPLLQMQGTVREIALEVICADDRRLPVLVNSDLKRNAAGEPLLIRTTVFDATDRREYERELMLARNRERAAGERTERLARITMVLAGALDLQQIVAAMMEGLTEIVAADRALLALVDEQEGRLRVVAWHGSEAADLNTWRFRGAEPEAAATHAFQSRKPRFYDESEASRKMPATLPAAAPELGALAVLPLVVEGRSIGVLSVGVTAARRFSEEDRAFMLAAASQCAQAVERVHLHEQTTRATRRWAFLAETSSALDESPELARRAQRLVDLVVSQLADVAQVDITEGGDRTTVAVAARDQNVRSLGQVAGAGPGVDAAVAKAIASGEPQLLLGPGARPSHEPRSGARPVALSFAALPLRVRGRVLGALTLSSFEPERRFGQEDLAFLSGLADRAALALENARLYEQERSVAHTLQQSLLAGDPPRDPRFRVATKYRPAVETLEVGGDWYDTFPVAEGTIGIVVGDVVGRGIQAASAMGQLRSALRALAGSQLGPARLIEHLDAFVEQVETARWATLAYAEIELDSGRTRFACAGHPPPLLAQPSDSPRLLWEGRSTPVATIAGLPPRSEAALTLEPGARLLLYTDGLFERRNRSLDEGLDRLVDEFERRRDLPLSTLIDELTEAMLADEQGQDDVCLLCLSYGALRSSEVCMEADSARLQHATSGQSLKAGSSGRWPSATAANRGLLAPRTVRVPNRVPDSADRARLNHPQVA